MSSSYRKSSRPASCGRAVPARLRPSRVATSARRLAADTYVQPQVDLRGENNDNFDLDTRRERRLGRLRLHRRPAGADRHRHATQRHVDPAARAVPGVSGSRRHARRFEAFLDLRSQYEWERSEFLTYSASTPARTPTTRSCQAASSTRSIPTDPNNTGLGQAPGRRNAHRFATQSELHLRLTERTRLGLAAQYEAVTLRRRFGQIHADRLRLHDRPRARRAGHSTPAATVSVGAYASKYEATDNSTETRRLWRGASDTSYRWSEVIGVEAEPLLRAERHDRLRAGAGRGEHVGLGRQRHRLLGKAR